MKSFIITITLLFTSVFIQSNSLHAQKGKLDGLWKPFSEEFNGQSLPAESFKDQSLLITDSNYTFTAESIDKGSVVINGNKMDIYGKEGVNAGKHFTAIFKYENEVLTICYNLAGDSYPDSFDSKAKAALFLCSFKKQP